MTRHSPEYLKISQGLFDQFINDKLLGRQRNIFLPGMLVTVCPASHDYFNIKTQYLAVYHQANTW